VLAPPSILLTVANVEVVDGLAYRPEPAPAAS
jgi:hypothetical protein